MIEQVLPRKWTEAPEWFLNTLLVVAIALLVAPGGFYGVPYLTRLWGWYRKNLTWSAVRRIRIVVIAEKPPPPTPPGDFSYDVQGVRLDNENLVVTAELASGENSVELVVYLNIGGEKLRPSNAIPDRLWGRQQMEFEFRLPVWVRAGERTATLNFEVDKAALEPHPITFTVLENLTSE